MAGTYKLISSVTVGSGGASSIDFTSIPQTYTDLVLKVSSRMTNGSNNDLIYLTLNSSTSSFTTRWLYGSGSGTSSATDARLLGWTSNYNDTANTFGNAEVYIPNYTGSNYKSVSWDGVGENNATAAEASLSAQLWSNTAAITSVSLVPGAGTFVQYSTAYLYGVEIPANQITPKATGGDITYDSSYIYHTFRQSSTFTPTQSLTAEVLVVAGGGGAANAGGGAGGLSYHSGKSLTAQAYTVTIGSGGTGAAVNNNTATNGSNSVFSDITSNGGGADAGAAARSGGSGSGAYTGSGGAATQGNTGGATGYGNAGGNPAANVGGSGGGAGAAGTAGGTGGAGLNTWSSWASVTATGDSGYYAGGGGTYNYGNSATSNGGAGGGGKGGGGNGVTNTGGGAGAGLTGGNGGSGIVIVRYAR